LMGVVVGSVTDLNRGGLVGVMPDAVTARWVSVGSVAGRNRGLPSRMVTVMARRCRRALFRISTLRRVGVVVLGATQERALIADRAARRTVRLGVRGGVTAVVVVRSQAVGRASVRDAVMLTKSSSISRDVKVYVE
jgi:hypothetical protein